jgi:hypothetical protein
MESEAVQKVRTFNFFIIQNIVQHITASVPCLVSFLTVCFWCLFQNFDHLFKVNDKKAGGSFYIQSKVNLNDKDFSLLLPYSMTETKEGRTALMILTAKIHKF